MRLLLPLAVLALTTTVTAQAPKHPLDGLSVAEHWVVYDAIRGSGRADSSLRLAYVGLKEPPKAEVLGWRPGQPFRREAAVHLIQGGAGYQAVVDLIAKRVLSWEPVPTGQQMPTSSESGAAGELAKSDPRVVEALTKRGLTDLSKIGCFPINYGYFDLPEERGKRVARIACSDLRGSFAGWGRPIEGLVAVVSMVDKKVLRVIDTGTRPPASLMGEHGAEDIGQARAATTPIAVTQVMGPGFTIDGQSVSWQNWRFHFRVDPRRGIVLSTVRYQDGGRERSVMYQGSLSELFVPYMDPDEPWNYQGYFDLGNYPSIFRGVASTLEPGSDCPANAAYFDAVVMLEDATPTQRARAACLFERLGGEPAWRHVRDENRTIESRARRDLVLRMIIGAGNYDYVVDWMFMQEGMIRVNVGATGIDQVKGARTRGAERTAAGEREDRYGRFIAPFLVGVNHSHFLSFRLDMDVDGTANSFVVDKLATERLPAANPRKSIWVVNSTVAAGEKDAMRHSTMDSPEFWRVINPSVSGRYGDPVGFEIGGSHAQSTLMAPDDYLRQRAGFTDHTIWATPFDPKELYAAGDYPMFNPPGAGLPTWTKANRSIANNDLVVWYTVGFHHVPRPEDWPVMPVSWHSFEIRPVGFFERNPALDLRKEP